MTDPNTPQTPQAIIIVQAMLTAQEMKGLREILDFAAKQHYSPTLAAAAKAIIPKLEVSAI